MRRVVLLIAVVAVAAGAGVVVLAQGGHRATTRTSLTRTSLTRSLAALTERVPLWLPGPAQLPAPAPRVTTPGGTTCFVAGDGSCSLTPCVEFVAVGRCVRDTSPLSATRPRLVTSPAAAP